MNPAQKTPWKTAEEIAALKHTRDRDGNLVRIGGRGFGDVCEGRLQLKGGKWIRVAIKHFKNPLSDELATRYKDAISDLLEAQVPIPKMSMYKHQKHGWMQISQLFKSRGKTKIREGHLPSLEHKMEAIGILARVANAGYQPWPDLIEPLREPHIGVIPIDLDAVVRMHAKTTDGPQLASELVNTIKFMSQAEDEEERRQLVVQASKIVKPEIRENLITLAKRIGINVTGT